MNPMENVSGVIARDESVWDALWEHRPIGRIAIVVRPGKERGERAAKACGGLYLRQPEPKPRRWTDGWREALLTGIAALHAGMQLPGDCFPALRVPRFAHGQSQGICDLFGAAVEPQEDGNFFVRPLPADPKRIDAIRPARLDTSMYWGAVEWIRYARSATDGAYAFRNPVLTGPFDTANYLLGTTVLLEWVYTEAAALHRLLEKITDVLAAMISALKEAAGGELHGDSLPCMRGGVCLCSECRSIVSEQVYEQFEAPYLRRLGEETGPYGIHSCGSWERTVPSALEDPNLRAMNGQVMENDLSRLCELADRGVTLSIRPSQNLDERYTWATMADFYRYIIETAPPSQPLEISVSERDVPLWNRLCGELGANHSRLSPAFD